MSDTPAPPAPGTLLWGNDLNTYLLSLEARIAANETLFATEGGRIDSLDTRVGAVEVTTESLDSEVDGLASTVSEVAQSTGDLDGRVTAIENKPEYVVNSYSWQYSNQSPPPTGNQVRADNADLSQATALVFRLLDGDGADRTPVFQLLTVGSMIRINDWDDATKLHRFNVTGPANIDASDVTVPVEWVEGNGTIPNAKANVAFIVALVL